MIKIFSILAILLACMGMHKLVTFMINNRIKAVTRSIAVFSTKLKYGCRVINPLKILLGKAS